MVPEKTGTAAWPKWGVSSVVNIHKIRTPFLFAISFYLYLCFSVEDAGRFTCVAENDAGHDSMDIDLVVHGLSAFSVVDCQNFTSSHIFSYFYLNILLYFLEEQSRSNLK